jgi:ribosomal protein S18 acetylase RimI-like enzyme
MYYILEITENNKEMLKKFIKDNILPNTFRYFNKRTSCVIKNHVITILLMDSELPIGYAHIDFDENKYWLGICILDKYQGKGYGKQMIEYLFNNNKIKNIDEIYLTVDKINTFAINLYLKFNFVVVDEKETYFMMLRQNNL